MTSSRTRTTRSGADRFSAKAIQRAATQKLSDRQVRNIRRRLLYWGRRHYREYPWRTEADPWLTFVAELFLQRTRAGQVRDVYVEFRDRYATPLAFLIADPKEVSRVLHRLGLKVRLTWLRDIAAVAAEHGGVLPEEMDELTKLRGVGTYTAAAWLSLHRGKRAALVDSNVTRWLSRMTGNPYSRDPRGLAWVVDLAERLTPPRAFQEYNYAVLDFTMEVCRPRNPGCAHCPNRVDCDYGSVAFPRKIHSTL